VSVAIFRLSQRSRQMQQLRFISVIKCCGWICVKTVNYLCALTETRTERNVPLQAVT